jgi:hypothetical protein
MFGGGAGLGDLPHRHVDSVDGLTDGTVSGAPTRAPPERPAGRVFDRESAQDPLMGGGIPARCSLAKAIIAAICA